MFILFPIGHEEDSVRRLPWMTITILLACVAIQVFSIFTPVDVVEEIARTGEEVRYYWVERSYLELHPELRPGAQRWALEDAWGPGGPREVREPSASRKREQQAQLDRLTDSWLAARDQIPIYRFGLIPVNLEIGDLVAHMFLHAGWMHLIGNMIFLWLTGPALEDVWGRPYFAALYVATGVFGGLVWTALYPSSTVPTIGASGAVAGLMGAFMVRYAKTPVKMFYFIFWFFPFILRTGTFNAPAALMLGLWFTQELLAALFLGGHSGVAFAVHVAGFAFGAGAALLIRHRRIEQKIAPKLDEKLGGDNFSNPAIEDAHELRQKGRHDKAWDILAEEVRRRPGNFEAGMALWDVGMELGRQQEAAPMFLRCIRSELRQGELELGLYHWYELVDQIPAAKIDLELRIRLAEAMLGSQRDEDAADLLADADSMLEASASMGVRIRLARVAARARSASAPALCGPLLNNPAVPDKLRQELAQAYSGIKAFGLRPKPAATTAAAPLPAAPPVPPPVPDEAPLPLADDSPPDRVLKVMAAVPRRLTGDKLSVDVQGQGARTLPLSRIQGVAVGRIEEGFASNYVVIDLLVDSLWTNRPAVRTVRFQSTDFDPREVLPALDGKDPLQA